MPERECLSPGARASTSPTPSSSRLPLSSSPLHTVSIFPSQAHAAAAAPLALRRRKTIEDIHAVLERLSELHAQRQTLLGGSFPSASGSASPSPPLPLESSPPSSGWVPPPPHPPPTGAVRAKSPARRRRAPSPRTSFWAGATRGSARSRVVAYNEGNNLAAAAAVAATALSPAARAALMAENLRQATDADKPLRRHCFGGQLAAGRTGSGGTTPSVQRMRFGVSRRVALPCPPADCGVCNGDRGGDGLPADSPLVGWQPTNLDPDSLRAAIVRRQAADDAYRQRLAEFHVAWRSRRVRTHLDVLPTTTASADGGIAPGGVPVGGLSERSESVVVSPAARGATLSTPPLLPFASSVRGAALPTAQDDVALPPSGKPPDVSALADGLTAAFGGGDDGERVATKDGDGLCARGAAGTGDGGVRLTRGRSPDRRGLKRRRSLSPSVSSLTPPVRRSATPPTVCGGVEHMASAGSGGAVGDDAAAEPCQEGGIAASSAPAAAADSLPAAPDASALVVTGVRSPSAVNDAAMTDIESFYSATGTGMRLPGAAAAAVVAAAACAGVATATTPTPSLAVAQSALPPAASLTARDPTSRTDSSVGASVGARTRSAAAAAAAVAAASLPPPGAHGGVLPSNGDLDSSSSSSTSGSGSSTSDGVPGWVRNAAVIPDQAPPSAFRWAGGGVLLDDPLADTVNRRLINPWTPAERLLFLRRFVAYPKNFRRIASAFKRKSVADVVAHYYRVKLSQSLKQLPAVAAACGRGRLAPLLRRLAAVVPKERSMASNFAWEAAAPALPVQPRSLARGAGPARDAVGTASVEAPAADCGSPWSAEEVGQLLLGLCRLGQPPIESAGSSSSARESNGAGDDVGGGGGCGGGGGSDRAGEGRVTAADTPNGYASPPPVAGTPADRGGTYWAAMAAAVGAARSADDCRNFFVSYREKHSLHAFGLPPPPRRLSPP